VESAEEIPVTLEYCAERGADTIVIDGGDGTAGAVFSALLNLKPYSTLPALALLPSGKANMSAAALSLAGNRDKALQTLFKHHRDDNLVHHVRENPILRLVQRPDSQPIFGTFFGTADVVEGILYCRNNIYPLNMPDALSHAAAITVLFWRTLIGKPSKHSSYNIRWDDKAEEKDGLFKLVTVTTLPKLLLGVVPFPTAKDGPMHFFSLDTGAEAIFRFIPELLKGKLGSNKPVRGQTSRRTRSLSLTFDGAYTLDGELYKTTNEQTLQISANQLLKFVKWQTS